MQNRYFFHIAGDLDIRDPRGGEYMSEAAARRSAEARLRNLRQKAAARHVKIVVMNN
jgi:hypothetical protein